METIGQRLRAARQRAVLTQAELAQRAGVSLITVTRLETGAGSDNPRPKTVRELAAALGVDPGWLMFGDQGSPLKTAA